MSSGTSILNFSVCCIFNEKFLSQKEESPLFMLQGLQTGRKLNKCVMYNCE
jgi:hypothetical protein